MAYPTAIFSTERRRRWRSAGGGLSKGRLFLRGKHSRYGECMQESSTWETFHIIRNQTNPSMVHIQAIVTMACISRSTKDANQLTADFQGDSGWDTNDATFVLKVSTWLGGEYQLTNGRGLASAPGVVMKHRESFIQENDFWILSRNGIHTVRIPLGWWIASDPNPPAPYVSGSLQALDNAFQWAKYEHKFLMSQTCAVHFLLSAARKT